MIGHETVSVIDENPEAANEYEFIKTNFLELKDRAWHDLMHSEIRLFEVGSKVKCDSLLVFIKKI